MFNMHFRRPNVLSGHWHYIVPGKSVTLALAYEYAIAQGYTDQSFEKFVKDYRDPDNRFNALDGTIRECLMGNHRTFGVYEPTYLELLGANEIQRFRELVAPRCLLLGCLGSLSALEFAAFLRKINPSAIPVVIDISDESVCSILQGVRGTEICVVRGDAVRLPFAPESFTYVFTNYLFYALGGNDCPFKAHIHRLGYQLFAEVSKALEHGGSFLMVESPIRDLSDKTWRLRFNYCRTARKSHLLFVQQPLRPLSYVLNPEVMSAEVDKDGRGYCPKALICEDEDDIGYRFVK